MLTGMENMPHPRCLALACLLSAGAAGALISPVASAVEIDENIEWHTVMRDRDRQVQINRSTVTASSDGTKVAWARLLLSPTEATEKGYVSVRTLNRYDCAKRTYTTIKREYLDAQLMIVKEERPQEETPRQITRYTVDERLWREVCDAPQAGKIQDLVRQADQAAGDLKAQ